MHSVVIRWIHSVITGLKVTLGHPGEAGSLWIPAFAGMTVDLSIPDIDRAARLSVALAQDASNARAGNGTIDASS